MESSPRPRAIPREASSLDDGALIWLFPRADKDLLAQIKNPKLPQSHFATFQTRAGQCVPLRQAGRQLVRDRDPAGHHRRRSPTSSSGSIRSTGRWPRECSRTGMKLSLRAGRLGRQSGRDPLHGRQRPGLGRRARQAGRRGHRPRRRPSRNRRIAAAIDPPSPARPAPYRRAARTATVERMSHDPAP